MATHSAIFAWEIPWTEEPGELQSLGLQRVWYNWVTEQAHTQANKGWGAPRLGADSHACFFGLSLQDKPHRRAQDKKRNELGESAEDTLQDRKKSSLCLSDADPGRDLNDYVNDHITSYL